MIAVGADKGVAITKAKATAFYKHTGFQGATSHVDDKYGVDVDDVYAIQDILPSAMKEKYSIIVSASESGEGDAVNLGYFQLHKL